MSGSLEIDHLTNYCFLLLHIGVGWSIKNKLESAEILTVADILKRGRESLQREVGKKTGDLLFGFAHGRDDRQVEHIKVMVAVHTSL